MNFKVIWAAITGKASINEDIDVVGKLATGMNFGDQAGLAKQKAEELIQTGKAQVRAGEDAYADADARFEKAIAPHLTARDRRQTDALREQEDGEEKMQIGASGLEAANRMLNIK